MVNELKKRILSSILLLPLLFFFILKGSIYFNFLLFIIVLITIYEWHFLSFKKIYYLPGLIFIFFFFYSFYFLRIEGDFAFFILILLTCIFTDIGGYAFGKIFKGPKLTKISPNKTYSGVFGGFLLSTFFSILYIKNIHNFNLYFNNRDLDLQLLIIILFISLISQIGDLVISFFKRKSKIKNTGKIIPGHGGLLDRIDGMIFVFPFMFILTTFL